MMDFRAGLLKLKQYSYTLITKSVNYDIFGNTMSKIAIRLKNL